MGGGGGGFEGEGVGGGEFGITTHCSRGIKASNLLKTQQHSKYCQVEWLAI